MIDSVRFAHPLVFVLLPIALLPVWGALLRPRLAWPRAAPRGRPSAARMCVAAIPIAAQCVAILAVLVALARPQSVAGTSKIQARSVAIVLALDVSRSMLEADFPSGQAAVTRLDAAKSAFLRFIESRPDDLIGLVGFADYPDTACPPTLDHPFLIESLMRLPPAPPDEPGTNLGDAVAWALRDLRETSPPHKVLVLATDGQNEPGVPEPLDPTTAARLASQLGVRVHVIAIGPEIPPSASDIARASGGTISQARAADSLASTLEEISRIERSPVSSIVRTRYLDWFPACLWIAMAALFVDPLWRCTPWRRLT